MRAIVCPRYGGPDVLEMREVERPRPKDDEVCMRIVATAVTPSDVFIRGSDIPLRSRIPMRLMIGVTRPRRSIIGLVLAGEIASVGRNTTRSKPGDQVYGLTGFGLGAYAEYKCMKETDSMHGCLALKPANLTHEESTGAAYGGLLALQYMERGDIQPGESVLVYGASGTSGTTAVQYAKHLGAEVTAVCSTPNVELVQSLGADSVIDYTKVDGLEAGQIRPVVDRCYPLEEMVEAHRYVGKGHKRGGVAVTVARRSGAGS
jgi:NADPH:quinone reductase-like Zn-dependent oxidoreductase